MGYSCNACGRYVTSGGCGCYSPPAEPVDAGGCAPPVIASVPPADVDTIALEVARRFTLDTEPQRRASLQVAVVEAITAALANQQGVGAGADEPNCLLREVVDNLAGVGCEPCIGSHSPMEDLHGRIEQYLRAQQPEVPDGDPR